MCRCAFVRVCRCVHAGTDARARVCVCVKARPRVLDCIKSVHAVRRPIHAKAPKRIYSQSGGINHQHTRHTIQRFRTYRQAGRINHQRTHHTIERLRAILIIVSPCACCPGCRPSGPPVQPVRQLPRSTGRLAARAARQHRPSPDRQRGYHHLGSR